MFYRSTSFFTGEKLKLNIQGIFEIHFRSMETDKYEELGELDTIQSKFKNFDFSKLCGIIYAKPDKDRKLKNFEL